MNTSSTSSSRPSPIHPCRLGQRLTVFYCLPRTRLRPVATGGRDGAGRQDQQGRRIHSGLHGSGGKEKTLAPGLRTHGHPNAGTAARQRLTSWGIILAGLLLIAFFANAALYREKTGGLHDIMTGLLGQENSAAEASPSGKTGN